MRLGDVPPAAPYAWYLANTRREFQFVVFDLDAARGDVARDLVALVELLDVADVRHLVCRSGPGGGMHVWVPVGPTPAVVVRSLARAAARRLPSLDIAPLMNPRTGCVRPPGAPHRAGSWSTPLRQGRPLSPEETTAVLARPNAAEALERLAVVLDVDPVEAEQIEAEAVRTIEQTPHGPRLAGTRRPCDVADLLAQTPPPGRGHAHLARILVRLALARWSPLDVAALLDRDQKAPGLVHLRRQGSGTSAGRPRGTAERAALIRRQWSRAVDYAATLRRDLSDGQRPGEETDEWTERVAAVVELATAVRQAIEAVPKRWSTQAGPSDRRALEYVLELALDAVSDEIEIDCRRLALATGMGRSTAARALTRLCLDQWLSLSASGDGQRAHRYRILPPRLTDRTVDRDAEASVTNVTGEQGGTQAIPRPGGALPLPGRTREALRTQLRQRRESVAHDVFAHPNRARSDQGLGRHAANTYAALVGADSPDGIYKVRELAELTGYSVQTTQRHLETLAAQELVQERVRPRPGWRAAPGQLDLAARRIGALGRSERRRHVYAIERELYGWWLAEQEWMRARGKRRRARAQAAGQGRLILPGLPRYAHRARYPRADDGRADHAAARSRLTHAGRTAA
ncbi:hypothetical protein ACFHYQ_08830 [Sphaerimonospora cavernae]|uniref:Uncharacterized protein n=1 Tax=Sphaerimonospora cavernae TaxID=1740611 RepID=A0ABV6U1S0_9ACTN